MNNNKSREWHDSLHIKSRLLLHWNGILIKLWEFAGDTHTHNLLLLISRMAGKNLSRLLLRRRRLHLFVRENFFAFRQPMRISPLSFLVNFFKPFWNTWSDS